MVMLGENKMDSDELENKLREIKNKPSNSEYIGMALKCLYGESMKFAHGAIAMKHLGGELSEALTVFQGEPFDAYRNEFCEAYKSMHEAISTMSMSLDSVIKATKTRKLEIRQDGTMN